MDYAPLPSDEQLRRLGHQLTDGGKVHHVRRIEGGLGCTTDVVELSGGGAQRTLVLRRYGPWWNDSKADPGRREFAALSAARAVGVPAPEPVWADTSGIFSERAIVISYVDGAPLLDPIDRIGWATQLAQTMARIHSAPLSPALCANLRDLAAEERDAALMPEAPRRVAQHPLGSALWTLRAEMHRDVQFAEPVFVHADFWPGNTLWRDGRLLAVVDWEDAGFGDPAADVAYSISDLRYQGFDEAARRLVDVYRAETGRTLDTLAYWNVAGLLRPMPDIGQWLPTWNKLGFTDMTLDQLRRRHTELVEQALDR